MSHKLKDVTLQLLKDDDGKVKAIGIVGEDYTGKEHPFAAFSVQDAKDIAHLMLRAIYIIESGREVPDNLTLD